MCAEEQKIMKATLLASFLFAAVLVALTSTAIASTTWYVNGASGSNSNACTSLTAACKTVGQAISLAASGDSIRVAAATYPEHLTISISLNVLGSGAKTTILEGGSAGTVVTISTAAHVTPSGVTITNGNWLVGAGITNKGVLTLPRSAVSGNRVNLACQNCAALGGGIANAAGAILTIGNSTVSGNHVSLSGCTHSCSARGGGIYNVGTLVLYNRTIY